MQKCKAMDLRHDAARRVQVPQGWAGLLNDSSVTEGVSLAFDLCFSSTTVSISALQSLK